MVSREAIEALSGIDDLSDRLEKAAWLVSGNIVEIGGGEGMNTIRFLRVAREKKRTVVVVDPFEQIEGADESYFKPYTLDKFLNNIVGKSAYLADHLHLIKKPSQDPDAMLELAVFYPIGMVFVDGLQDKASVLSDLNLSEMLEAEIICVDDFDRLTTTSEVPFAVVDFLNQTKYKLINIGKREVYFIK